MLSVLVANAKLGGDAAVNTLLSVMRPALLKFFTRSMAADAAEDFTQSALVRIHRALPSIDAERAHPFIVTVAYNLARTAYSQHGRDSRRNAPEQLADELAIPTAADRHTEYEELAAAAHRVASIKMPQAQREVVLGLLRGENAGEIAQRLGISPITVRTRLMRARATLHRELRPYLDTVDDGPQNRAG
ncbi:MAG TPA: sigma-70 family RNA polymerase sigma factor [Longimicrobium sp.]